MSGIGPVVAQVDDLCVHGVQGVVVGGVSFRIRAGQVLALVGESGSGKTTTALVLMGEARDGEEQRIHVKLPAAQLVVQHLVERDP